MVIYNIHPEGCSRRKGEKERKESKQGMNCSLHLFTTKNSLEGIKPGLRLENI